MSSKLAIAARTPLWPSASPGSTPASADRPPTRAIAPSRDPLPSWHEGTAKAAIIGFVGRVTRTGGPDFVPTEDRIAVFDNDGTLWIEKPICTAFAFAFDRLQRLAPRHPEWKSREPFRAILDGDLQAAVASGECGILEAIAVAHANTTTAEFEDIVADWISTARHPRFDRCYTELVYAPMLELLGYLRANGFSTFIASSGGVEFLRPWVDGVYGIPPERVIGSRVKTRYEVRGGTPVLYRLPEVDLVDDKIGRPIGINEVIGRRPIAAFGNSDGDFEMLEWTTSGAGPRFGLIVHHTDAEREYAYDRDSHVGRLARALDEAPARGWVVVDMKNDWKRIFSERRSQTGLRRSFEQLLETRAWHR